jgi:outer membrane protein assembly factor BamB
LLKEWPKEGPRQLWNVDLSGGFSSVVVADGRVLTMTKEKNQEVVVCLDAASGKDIWRYRYDSDYTKYKSFTGGGRPQARTGPRATPTVDGDHVYTLGATGTLLCLDVKTGDKIWQQDLLKISEMDVPTHGFCGSPLIIGDRIYLAPGGTKGKSIAALSKVDGNVVWQALDDPVGYATPVWAEVGGASQVIFFTGVGAIGVDPKNGKLLWRFPWQTKPQIHVATPIYADGNVFISSDYGTGGALFRLTEKAEPVTVWKNKAMANHFSSSVLYEGNLYGFSEPRLRCVDFKTGDIKWDHPGLGRGSVVIADGKLIALSEQGELILANATPAEFSEISLCRLFADSTLTWTAPVVSGGKLFVRHENGLVALDLRGKAE